MKMMVIQEITEHGKIILHRESCEKASIEEIEYWENFYSNRRGPYDGCSFNSDAVVINVYDVEEV